MEKQSKQLKQSKQKAKVESSSESESDSETKTEIEAKQEIQNTVEKDEQMFDLLKNRVENYVRIDDLISEKRAEIKELIIEKVQFEEYIKNYLEKTNKTKIETASGEISFVKHTTRAPLKDTLIETTIAKKVQTAGNIKDSAAFTHEIMDELNNLRGVNIKNNIKRVKKPKKKSTSTP